MRITRADDTIRLWKSSAMNDELAFTGNAISYDLSDDGQRNAFQSDIYNFAVSPPGPQNLWLSVTTNTTATSLTLAYINPLNETCSSVLTVTVAVVSINLVPDSNHDRVIDASDVTTNTFHFWINDDANSGDISSGNSDVPGQSGSSANYSSSTVCGRNDLLDFFPVWLDVSQALALFPPGGNLDYRLSQADSAVKIVYTQLTKANAGNYLMDTNTTYGNNGNGGSNSWNADTVLVGPSGSPNNLSLPAAFLNMISNNPTTGILMVECVATSSAPLNLEIWQNNQKIVSVAMPLQTSSIGQMYRWINLRHFTDGNETDATNTNEPPNYPDALCNGKQFVHIHGFLTDEPGARAGASQIFKRLYHSGSRAMFTMVSWQGDVSGMYGPALYYHEDVMNAFIVASNYAATVSQLPGSLYLSAHSLGNMVVSTAMTGGYGLNPVNYFMFDAAVAAEAYNGGVSNLVDMVPPEWMPYDTRLWASSWWKLFPTNDARHGLTWQNRFGNIPQAVNYFSSGEDVLADNPSGSDLSVNTVLGNAIWSFFANWFSLDQDALKNQVWIFQEYNKGAIIFGVLDSDSWWALINPYQYGGWSFNFDYYVLNLQNQLAPMPTSQANALASSNSVLQTDSFFQQFYPTGANGLYGTNGNAIAATYVEQSELLAKSVPAVSCAAGRNSINDTFFTFGQGNADMMSFRILTGPNQYQWPTSRSDQNWRHGDFKDVAYYFVYSLWDNVVQQGSLK